MTTPTPANLNGGEGWAKYRPLGNGSWEVYQRIDGWWPPPPFESEICHWKATVVPPGWKFGSPPPSFPPENFVRKDDTFEQIYHHTKRRYTGGHRSD